LRVDAVFEMNLAQKRIYTGQRRVTGCSRARCGYCAAVVQQVGYIVYICLV